MSATPLSEQLVQVESGAASTDHDGPCDSPEAETRGVN